MTTRALLLAALCLASVAYADIPPPPGYVETCTVELQCKPAEEGRTCGADHTNTTACEKTLGKEGFTKRCQTNGASVWTEVWCRPKAKKKPTK